MVSSEVGRRVLKDVGGVRDASFRHDFDGQKWTLENVANMGRSVLLAGNDGGGLRVLVVDGKIIGKEKVLFWRKLWFFKDHRARIFSDAYEPTEKSLTIERHKPDRETCFSVWLLPLDRQRFSVGS